MRTAFRWLAYLCLALGAIGILLGAAAALALLAAPPSERSADLGLTIAGIANGLILILVGAGVRTRTRLN